MAIDLKFKAAPPCEVFLTFVKLGLTSFGGPVAHIGYFQRELIDKRKWLDLAQFTQLLAICQLLPGPASSQLGFALGLLRAGWLGALAAFIAFTLPSALLLFAFSAALPRVSGAVGDALVHGLKLVAVVVVADALVTMARRLCNGPSRAVIAICSAALLIAFSNVWLPLIIILFAAIAGIFYCRDASKLESVRFSLPYGPRVGQLFLLVFFALLVGLPFVSETHFVVAVVDGFYRAGALVFGGGHVVLPLLEDTVVAPGWIEQQNFLAGYGAAQAVPGPLFSFASYLGAQLFNTTNSGFGAGLALVAIFLPGFLLVLGVLPLWQKLVLKPRVASSVAGINAAVVGILGAAFYQPVCVNTIFTVVDLAVALIGFCLISILRLPVLWAIAWCLSARLAIAYLL